jgi:hypothetical protein
MLDDCEGEKYKKPNDKKARYKKVWNVDEAHHLH